MNFTEKGCDIMLDYEININSNDVDRDSTEIWAAAFLWLDDDHGVEYNLSYDSGECCSAIYKTEINDSGYLETDYSTFEHYEIDFNDPEWKEKFVTKMKEVALKFHGDKGDNYV